MAKLDGPSTEQQRNQKEKEYLRNPLTIWNEDETLPADDSSGERSDALRLKPLVMAFRSPLPFLTLEASTSSTSSSASKEGAAFDRVDFWGVTLGALTMEQPHFA